MQTLVFKGYKEEILNNLLQYIAQLLPTAVNDFEIIEFVSLEIFSFWEEKSVPVQSVTLQFNNSNIIFNFYLANFNDDNFELRKSFLNFMNNSGLTWIINDCSFTSSNTIIVKYSLTYIDESMSAKRFYMIKDYWKTQIMFATK